MAEAESARPGSEPPGSPVQPRPVRGHGAPCNEGQPDLPALLEGASRGDEGAWRALIALYGRRVFAMARSRRLCPDLAEEVTQSVFATVATKLRQDGGYCEQGRFESWLFRITVNRVRDEIRRLQRHADPTDPQQFAQLIDRSPAPNYEQQVARSADHSALHDALGVLPDADREVIELRHHAGLEFKRIAEILGQPIGTVLARHHRTLRKLKEILGSMPSERDS